MANDMSVKSKQLVFVGGKPIPAPRSAASRQCSVMSITSSNCFTNFSVQLTKQLATSENVAQHMQKCYTCHTQLGRSGEEIMKSFADYIAVVGVWTERCLTVVKAVKDRSLYGAFLSSLNRYHKGTSKQELRKVAMSTFANAVCQRLHEDLGIFKYWAAMILSDTMREVLDEDLLNEALHYLLVNDPAR
ncbi:Eukaryotic translation initiation factor 4 gamma 2 [Trypanosoma cruzi]|uniref:Eukaryotic translation initiation factor 4 gamma 2 n=1 Tax=Trypanosoma cruzi TaxID=5693 RepID=A0A2V2W0C9_TRYCR|nr:Eukaryotic translation initiation factor 4 gamma 2 [Trypanosoma cruzi]